MAARRLRRLLHFRLRTVLLLVALIALLAAGYRRYLLPYQRQHNAALALVEKGVRLEWQTAHPRWMRPMLNQFVDGEVLRDCIAVHAQHCALEDEDLQHLRAMPHVERLYAAGNPISDEGLRHLQNLQHLKTLSLWRTEITDQGLRFLSDLPQLTRLDLHEPRLRHFGPPRYGSARNSPAYRRCAHDGLPETGYRITSKGLEHLRNAPSLRSLIFSFPLDDAGLAALATMPKLRLRTLVLRDVTASGLAHLPRWPDLEMVRVERGAIGVEGLKPLLRLPRLRQLCLDWVQTASGVWAPLRQLHTLQELSLRGSSISNEDAVYLAPLANLRFLSLRETRVTDQGVRELNRLRRLEELNLLQTKVTANCLASLSSLTELRTLHLDGPLDDGAVAHLTKLKKLEWLLSSGAQLRQLYVTDAALPDLAQLDYLRRVALHDAEAGSALPGVNVPRDDRRLTSSGVRNYLKASHVSTVYLHGADLTSEALPATLTPDLDRVVLRSPRSALDVVREPLQLEAESAGISSRALHLDGGTKSQTHPDWRVEFTFEQGGGGLDLLALLPDIKHLTLHPGIQTGAPQHDWDNLRHVLELESLVTPGRRDLDVRANATAVRWIGKMKQLRRLVLDLAPGISAEQFKPLGQLKGLETLELHGGTPLTEAHLEVLARLSSLRELVILNSPGSLQGGGHEAGLRHFRRLEKLEELMLYQVSDAAARHLSQIPSLRRLSITGMQFTDQGSDYFDQMPRLEYLDARSTSITDERLESLNRRQGVYARTDR